MDGENLKIDYRFPKGDRGSIDELADEVVRLAPDVIVTVATPPAIAAKRATTTIPIVMATAGDPLSFGIVTNLAHPSGNITGVTLYGAELSGKRLEVFKKAVPASARVAVLGNQKNPLSVPALATNAGRCSARLEHVCTWCQSSRSFRNVRCRSARWC